MKLSDILRCSAIILAPLFICAETFQTSIQIRDANPSQFLLKWPSKVGKTYTVETSPDLVSGFSNLATGQQATHPENEWWVDQPTSELRRFYRISESGSEVVAENHIINGDFSNDFAIDWIAATAGTGDAGFSSTSEEFHANITSGGTSSFHVFLRQFNLSLTAGTPYTLSFKARSSAIRSIRILLQTNNGETWGNLASFPIDLDIDSTMKEYRFGFVPDGDYPAARLSFNLGNDDNDVYLDDIILREGNIRAEAYAVNARLGRGNNYMASKSYPNARGAAEDYALLNKSYFSHCRIGYKLDLIVSSVDDYTVPLADLQEIQRLVDFCLAEGLIVIIDPVHNWAAEPGYANDLADQRKLQRIWEQVAAYFADYDLENVLFEIMNEPRSDDDVGQIIDIGLTAIRNEPGNEKRIVIVCGDGFSTRQALIDSLGNGDIPADDYYLIGTFHYYDPFTFTKQGLTPPAEFTGVTWGSSSEFDQTVTDFDAVVAANNNFATSNGTMPIPIYLGEFGVDNEADLHNDDRERWLSWVRMQAEAHNFSWAHWNMYNNAASSKGMGPWTFDGGGTVLNPELRTFDAAPLEALIGRYEFEEGSRGGGVSIEADQPGFTGTGYAAFPAATGTGVWARADGLYIPKTDIYTVEIHYASAVDRTVRLVTPTAVINDVRFPATGGDDSWATLSVDIGFGASSNAESITESLKIVATPDEGPNLDWVHITAAP